MKQNIRISSTLWLLLLFIQSACSQGHLNNSNSNKDRNINEKKENPGVKADSLLNNAGDYADDELKAAEEEAPETSNILLFKLDELSPTKAEKEKKDQGISADKKTSTAKAPPAKVFRVRLQIQNNNDYPMWYLMPYNGAIAMPTDGRFAADPSLVNDNKMIDARRYFGTEAGSQLIELVFTGEPNQHFRAFYLPAGGSLLLSNYNIDCWQEADKVEFWAVRQLLVNNKRELQDCLSYSVLSSPKITVRCDKEIGCKPEPLENVGGQIQPPTEKISFIQAQKVSKYMVQLSK
jgi:hypothetical protein